MLHISLGVKPWRFPASETVVTGWASTRRAFTLSPMGSETSPGSPQGTEHCLHLTPETAPNLSGHTFPLSKLLIRLLTATPHSQCLSAARSQVNKTRHTSLWFKLTKCWISHLGYNAGMQTQDRDRTQQIWAYLWNINTLRGTDKHRSIVCNNTTRAHDFSVGRN